jgi:hypothetical protein
MPRKSELALAKLTMTKQDDGTYIVFLESEAAGEAFIVEENIQTKELAQKRLAEIRKFMQSSTRNRQVMLRVGQLFGMELNPSNCIITTSQAAEILSEELKRRKENEQ